ncbi:putative exocyst complex component Exo70, cullin repeat-like-containing domain-containing protein [Lupinus albus]|uniref:Exocyst subunit Exo70 family protein n=1 Tax=Lupinus albus TaxID=3870 RepID=A0A6A4NNH1_LUPAL|nr:putative exocyst complex component Exo70, cullin repeat-like-containing domain-containing protein [Lupinus albus]
MAVEESEVVIPELETEENLIATARHLVKALGSNSNLTSDAKKILADLGFQMCSINISGEKEEGKQGQGCEEDEKEAEEEEDVNAVEDQLGVIRDKIMRWEEDRSMIWDSGPEEAFEYLNAANNARQLTDKLESLHSNKEDKMYEFLSRAYALLQKAMSRLEEEFRNLLFQNRQPFKPEYVPSRSCEEDVVDENSIVSLGDETIEESLQEDSVSKDSEEHLIDLVHPDVILDLRCIANLLFASNHVRECSHIYTIARRLALDECLFILEMERLNIEDVLKMEWVTLNSEVKRWVWAMKIFVRVYLASERWLSDRIFGEGEPVSVVCFVDASKASILQLLNFGVAMSIGPHQPEKLFLFLEMYEVLANLMPDIDALYSDEVGSSVKIDCHEVLKRLGNCVRATFLEFGNAIASNASSTALVGGGIHPLTGYVMNYLRNLTDYSDTLNLLLKDQEEENPISLSSDLSPGTKEDSKRPGSPVRVSTMALRIRSFASILESKLKDKSMLYKEVPLQHLFLMNNLHYMAEKVKESELSRIFGDEWIRKCNSKFLQHAMDYKRASWSPILNLLKDEGIHVSAWLIPDVQLRNDVRISTSLQVVQAYVSFTGKHKNHINDKHNKYTADDLENYFFDFFEGLQKLLQLPHRK